MCAKLDGYPCGEYGIEIGLEDGLREQVAYNTGMIIKYVVPRLRDLTCRSPLACAKPTQPRVYLKDSVYSWICLTLLTLTIIPQVCHENVAHNGTLASGESLSVTVWRAVPSANPVCHFWYAIQSCR